MKRIVATVWLSLAPLVCLGAGAAYHPLDAKTDIEDQASLQRGAKLFVNFCLGCHSLKFMRYNRMGTDLGLTDEQVRENLLFSADKVTELMEIAMPEQAASRWFGVAPPDLSVIARSRGPDWLYTYLVTFYADPNPARPFGVNNVVFPDVGMPHVMASMQGVQQLVAGEMPAATTTVHPGHIEPAGDELRIYKTALTSDGGHETVVDVLKVTQPGEMQPGEYRRAMRDLVNFLTYVAEPARLVRYDVGFWVLVFIAIFFFVSRSLYKEYWKDVH